MNATAVSNVKHGFKFMPLRMQHIAAAPVLLRYKQAVGWGPACSQPSSLPPHSTLAMPLTSRAQL
jgi:hypothetical protein